MRSAFVLVIATAFCFPSAIAPAQAEGAPQSLAVSPATQFDESPITPGFWILSGKILAGGSEITKLCLEGAEIQFRDGHFLRISTKQRPHDAPEPRLLSAVVDEVGYCTFDRKSQTDHCDLAFIDENGATNKGVIDVRYSSEEDGVLKLNVTANTTYGPKTGTSETVERYATPCPEDAVRNLMMIVHPKQ